MADDTELASALTGQERSPSDRARMQAVMAGLMGPNDELTPEIMARLPKMTEGTKQYPWSDPIGNIMAGVEGMPMGRTVSAAPGAMSAGLSHILATVPKSAVAGGAGLAATLAGSGSSGGGDATALQRLYEMQSRLQGEAEEAKARREAQRPKGRAPSPQTDPQFTAADAEYNRIKSQLDGVSAQVANEVKINSPEYQLQVQKETQRAEEERKAREAATPFRERYPGIAGALPAIGAGLSFGLPFLLRGKANMSSFYPGSRAGQMRTAIGDAEAAMGAGGDPTKLAMRQKELSTLLAEQPSSELGKAAAAAGAGGTLTAEASMFPDQYDAYNLPAGEAQSKARSISLNPVNYLERSLMGTLTGFGGYKAGGLVPEKAAPTARAKAIVDMATPDAKEVVDPKLSEALGRLSPATFQPRKNGKFDGPPEYPKGHPKYDQGD
jgi:hypothetical protein